MATALILIPLSATTYEAIDHAVETAAANRAVNEWLAGSNHRNLAVSVQERQVLGFGSEAIGTDAGQGVHLRPPYPCHYFMHGAGRYGLQCLTNLDQLPPTGAVVIAAPLKIVNGSGSPSRVLALVAS